ncbi:MAG TPA: tetratricopeptide repeat protein [Thermoanaerobaculia bacterium]
MSYSVREVSAMLGLSPATIRDWAARGLIEAERGASGALQFGFRDLIVLRTVSELVSAKIPQRKVKRILTKLREQLPEGKPLTGIRITAEGEQVVVRDEGTVWNPESGQSLFDFSVAEIAVGAERLQSMTPDNDAGTDWYELACELESSSVEEAKQAYERAIRADPAHTDARVNLGRLLHESGDAASAARHYRAALEADPEHPTAAFNLGVALEDLGRLDEALQVYRRAIALDPENAEAHYNLAGVLERRGEKQAAIRHLKVYRTLLS